MVDSRAFRTGFVTLLLFTLLAGDAWRYSISWYGFGAIAVALTAAAVLVLRRNRPEWSALPLPLLAFLVLATLSLAWSFYPGWTALGILTTWMTATAAVATAVTFSWGELLHALGTALRIILGLSLVFELAVSLLIRGPILPLWVERPDGKVPLMLFWSRDWLFDGGPVQGIVGNSSTLAFMALLGVIVFGLQLATRRTGRLAAWGWMLVAAVTIALTRSATIYVALAALVFVLAAVWLVRRTRRPALAYSVILAVIAGAVLAVLLFGQRLLPLVGKSSDLTGRLGIWENVVGLAAQRPVAGWGWISYWVPWAKPFNDPDFIRNGVLQLHAHNAWLDVWLQLGILGLVVFGALVVTALVRAWRQAARPDGVLLPLLLLVALLVQSLAESRLLVEYGLLLLVIVAVKTKVDRTRVEVGHG